MITAVIIGCQLALAVNPAAELTAPDNQRVVEQAALFEIENQRGRSLIGVVALTSNRLRQGQVLVPAAMDELDEPHAALGQSSSQQAILAANVPGFRDSTRYNSKVCSDSLEASVSSGTDVCIR